MSGQSKEWLEEYRRNAVAIMSAKDAEIERLQSKLPSWLNRAEHGDPTDDYLEVFVWGPGFTAPMPALWDHGAFHYIDSWPDHPVRGYPPTHWCRVPEPPK